MKKSEIFDILLAKVCEVCEVSTDVVLAGKKYQSVVDARVLTVQYLRRIGLSNDDIALIAMRRKEGNNELRPSMPDLKKKAKGIQKMFDSYSQRCIESYAFCLMSADIKMFCRERYKELYLS